MSKEKKQAVILLSGGLDCTVCLDIALKTTDVKLALTFNYGQKAFLDENKAANAIAKYYNVEHKTIELPFLAQITDNALTNPNNDNVNEFNSVWVPNRNGLFLNIAAAYADMFNYDAIVFGANFEEAQSFPDNTAEFVTKANDFFAFSTLKQVEVLAPTLQFDKLQIINYAIDNNLPLNLIKSCYLSSTQTQKRNCGECLSCKLLLNALKKANRLDLIKEIF